MIPPLSLTPVSTSDRDSPLNRAHQRQQSPKSSIYHWFEYSIYRRYQPWQPCRVPCHACARPGSRHAERCCLYWWDDYFLSLRCLYLLILELLSIKSFNHRYRLFLKSKSIPDAFAIPTSRPWRSRRPCIFPVLIWDKIAQQVFECTKVWIFRAN